MANKQTSKKTLKPDRKPNDVWEFFFKTPLKSASHYKSECKFCHKKWNRAFVHLLQCHLANECEECPSDIQSYYLGFVTAISIEETETSQNKKRKKDQPGIESFYESRDLPDSKINAINQALLRAFVCCGISFAIIDNPFFRELLYQLRPNYIPPTRRLLSGRLLE